MKDLKEKAVRGGLAKICAQGANWVFRVGSLMILARLLDPKDFGLVAMVTAFTGVLNLFRDFGLSSATVQRVHVTDEQISTLFWINVLVGVILALTLAALAPAVVALYHEPRLLPVTVVLSTAFFFNALGIQHTAILERQMRFTALATIDVIVLIVSSSVGIGMALMGFGYWALVASAVTQPLVLSVCLLGTTRWIPGKPEKLVGVHPMLRFGGGVTLISLVVYIAYNFEKVLLGRFWGADALGLYGRAFTLANLPTDNLNSAVGGVALSGLSRIQNDPPRMRNYFLKGYTLIVGLTIPLTMACALFARDMILVVLGPKWTSAIDIFRLLAPTILVFAMINPLWWLTCALGMIGRNIRIVVVMAPLVITGYLIGLPHGPKGVALAYSSVMLLWALPCIAWSVHGTIVSARDILVTVARPLFSGIVAALAGLAVQFLVGQRLPLLPRLVLEGSALFGVYAATLLYGMGQKAFYMNLIRGLMARPAVGGKVLASA